MRVGDIKMEALKLMFANYSFDFSVEDLPNMFSDENYGSYLANMDGSISRGIDRIQNALVVPLKSKVIEPNELVAGKSFSRFDLSHIKDLYVMERITAEDDDGGYIGSAEYRLEGNSLVLENGLTYTVLYYPTLKTIDNTVGDTDEIWVPEHIARLLPYFVKSELYQEEEPSLAADARNTFEMLLDDLKKSQTSNQTRVKRVYGF